LSITSVRYSFAAASDVGCKRTSNEDAFGYSAEHGVYVVCDGMGGAAAGEIASSMAIEEVLRRLSERSKTEPAPLEVVVEDAIRIANEAILSRAQADPQLSGMGTTLVGLVTEGSRVLIFNVGDSRCYLLHNLSPEENPAANPDASPQPPRLEQISLDHSLVEEQVRMGQMTHAEAQHSNYRNVITRALGTQITVTPDLFNVEAEPGDIFLLCSDGLTGEISDEQIEAMLAADLPLDQLCVRLVDAAKAAGGHDNITCLLVRAEG
jgi:protein phosphatase